jgi:hypothetical protein
VNRWTRTQKLEAERQGWLLVAIDGDQNRLTIQKYDEADIFESDDAALTFVKEQAGRGNTTARQALEMIA